MCHGNTRHPNQSRKVGTGKRMHGVRQNLRIMRSLFPEDPGPTKPSEKAGRGMEKTTYGVAGSGIE